MEYCQKLWMKFGKMNELERLRASCMKQRRGPESKGGKQPIQATEDRKEGKNKGRKGEKRKEKGEKRGREGNKEEREDWGNKEGEERGKKETKRRKKKEVRGAVQPRKERGEVFHCHQRACWSLGRLPGERIRKGRQFPSLLSWNQQLVQG